ncbi:hypothetical protein K4K61_010473, partial [Colletotrichum sp. SAR11_59]
LTFHLRTTTATYLIDAYTVYSASVMAASAILRCLFGALLPLAGSAMFGALGIIGIDNPPLNREFRFGDVPDTILVTVIRRRPLRSVRNRSVVSLSGDRKGRVPELIRCGIPNTSARNSIATPGFNITMASQTPPPENGPNSPREFPDPAEYLDDPRFNRKFTLPPTPDLPEDFQVTYADFGHNDPADPSSTHVLLLCGPLLGSRYLHIAKDTLAKRHKVRIIDIDRPGFGGTTPVPPNLRIRAWLAIVPALLAHLGVRHVALAAHSGGTLYALNTLLHHRHLLSPSRPYVALCTPWVHPSHSGAAMMSLTSNLPQGLVGSFDKVAGFMVRSLVPATVGFSNAVSGMLSGIVPSLAGTPAEEYTAPGVTDVRLAEFEEKIWGTLIKRSRVRFD